MALFRREAVERQVHKLEGDVFVGVPPGWQAIGILLAASLGVAVAFLSTATYARVANAPGVVVPDKGVAVVTVPRPGTVADLEVRDGQAVAAGDVLMTVRAEEFLETGEGATAQVLALLRQQADSIGDQIAALRADAEAQVRQSDAQLAGIAAEIDTIDRQIALQQERITAAQAEIARIRPTVARGIISERDLAQREEALAERRQQLVQFEQSLAVKRSSQLEIARLKESEAARGRERIAGLEAVRAQVSQSLSSTERSRAFVLRAPVAGTVTDMTARVGMAVTPDVPVLALLPEGATLRAELSVPADAIGFVTLDQPVRLSIDTFPYERFGIVTGTVAEVARTSVAGEGGRRFYRVVADLDRDTVTAYGAEQPLVAGMTLTARIVTARQTLIEWLFAPLYALSRR